MKIYMVSILHRATINKAIHFARAVHSCHPFPPIGDAAYRQHATGGPSHGHRQHAQKLVKIARVVPEISSARGQTDTQTHSSQYFAFISYE